MIKILNSSPWYAKTTELLSFASELLGIEGDASITIICDSRRLDMLSKEYKFDAALLSTPLSGTYNLLLRDMMVATNPSVIFHEAVHLRQYVSGELVFDLKTGSCEWMGRKYSADYPYRQRPWEREAFSESPKIMREWKAAQKSVNKVRKCLFGKKSK